MRRLGVQANGSMHGGMAAMSALGGGGGGADNGAASSPAPSGVHKPASLGALLGLACHVLGVEYRKAPEHAWPTAAGDVHAALEWLGSASSTSGSLIPRADRHRVVLAGESST